MAESRTEEPKIYHVFLATPHHTIPMARFFKSLELSIDQILCVPEANRADFEAKTDLAPPAIRYYDSFRQLFGKLERASVRTPIVLHGLFRANLRKQLLRHPELLAQAVWVGWGADFYRDDVSLVQRLKKLCFEDRRKRKIVEACRGVVVLNAGDSEIFQERFGPAEVRVIPYPLIGMTPESPRGLESRAKRDESQPLRIMIGNSAAESNHHLEILALLAHLRDSNVRIWAPLNYGGPKDYVKEVIRTGKARFGTKFHGETKMLEKRVYDQAIADSDVVVFGHRRQQGLYVAYSALRNGAKLFLREETSSYRAFTRLGFNVGSTCELSTTSFDELGTFEPEATKKNSRLMMENYTEEALGPVWSDYLNGLAAAE